MSGNRMIASRNTVCFCLTVCLLLMLMAGCDRTEIQETEPTVPTPTEAEVIPTETRPKELSVTELMKAVLTLKEDLEAVLECVEEDDLMRARSGLAGIEQSTQTIRASLNATIYNLGDSATSIQKKLQNIQQLLDLVDLVSQKLLLPTIGQLGEYPTSEIKVGDGINTRWLIRYLDFAESMVPDVEEILAFAKTVDLSMVDDDGELAEYLISAEELLTIYRQDPAVFSWAKGILGAEGDRLYLLVAQNSAEIRASGGFPGSMGTVRIKDGVLTLGEFRSVYNVLSMGVPMGVQLSYEEQRLFNYLSGMNAPRDADLCPDFERVGFIWAAGYKAKNKEPLSGVISMTPHIVQKLLEVTEQEIVLFDGSVMSGENATRVLQYDIYYKYCGKDTFYNTDVSTDALFADAAQKTMEMVMNNLSPHHLLGYLSVAKESIEDRTLMFWMRDESEQAFVSKMGWGGGLNKDPEKPQAGVYFNCTVSSKQGMFLTIDTQMGERVQNADGSYTYPVTVTFANTITEKEAEEAGAYITGGFGGEIRGAAYFFAPAGGTVSDFAVDNGPAVWVEKYRDLQLGFLSWVAIRPGKTVTVTYSLTTAPGVETTPVFSQTPTVQ